MGLQCGLALPGPTGFNQTYYVDGGQFTSYKRTFSVLDCYLFAILTVEVLTYYEDASRSAAVLINGAKVGVIRPRSFSKYDELQLCEVFIKESFLISRAVPPAWPITGWQTIEIDPVRPPGQPASFNDAIVVGNCHVLFYR